MSCHRVTGYPTPVASLLSGHPLTDRSSADADASNHLMREPVDIELDPWRDLGYEDANAMEKLASQKVGCALRYAAMA